MTDALRWDLSDLYPAPDSARISDDLGRAKSLAADFAKKYRGRIALLGARELLEALQQMEQVLEAAYRPQLYAMLVFAGQTNDEKAQALMNLTRQATTDTLNEATFF